MTYCKACSHTHFSQMCRFHLQGVGDTVLTHFLNILYHKATLLTVFNRCYRDLNLTLNTKPWSVNLTELFDVLRADGNTAEHVIRKRGIRESRGNAEEPSSRSEQFGAGGQRSPKGDRRHDDMAERHEKDCSFLEQSCHRERLGENTA